VILSAPLTTETHHAIGADELAKMKPTAWVLNVARGSLIDQPALELALREKWIGGAYLDLTDPEPLPADSQLWHMPNVIVTPHSSQASAHTSKRALELFLDNLSRYRSGRELRNVVNLDAGY
jgi:phosphoglycerate dehydrogenase-like enzyme